jgi:hypothetical protein
VYRVACDVTTAPKSDAPILGEAAHELSHALGLKQSDHQESYDGGHTIDTAHFDWSNVRLFLTGTLESPDGNSFRLTHDLTGRTQYGKRSVIHL